MVEVKNWKNIEGKVFNEKAQRQVFSGENAMMVINTIQPGFPPFPTSIPTSRFSAFSRESAM